MMLNFVRRLGFSTFTLGLLSLLICTHSCLAGVVQDLPEDQAEEILALYRKHCKSTSSYSADSGSGGGYGGGSSAGGGGYGDSSSGGKPSINVVCKEGKEDAYAPPKKQIIRIPAEKSKKNIVFVEAPVLKLKHNINVISTGVQNSPRTVIYVLPHKASHELKLWDKRVLGAVGSKPQVFFLKGGQQSGASSQPSSGYGVPGNPPPASEYGSPETSYGSPPLISYAPAYGSPSPVPEQQTYGSPGPSPQPSYGAPSSSAVRVAYSIPETPLEIVAPRIPTVLLPAAPPAQLQTDQPIQEEQQPAVFPILPSAAPLSILQQQPSPQFPLSFISTPGPDGAPSSFPFDISSLGPEYEIVRADPGTQDAYQHQQLLQPPQTPQLQFLDSGSPGRLIFPSESIQNYQIQSPSEGKRSLQIKFPDEENEDESLPAFVKSFEERRKENAPTTTTPSSASTTSTTTAAPTTPTPQPVKRPRTQFFDSEFVRALIASAGGGNRRRSAIEAMPFIATRRRIDEAEDIRRSTSNPSSIKRSIKPSFEIIPAKLVSYSYSHEYRA